MNVINVVSILIMLGGGVLAMLGFFILVSRWDPLRVTLGVLCVGAGIYVALLAGMQYRRYDADMVSMGPVALVAGSAMVDRENAIKGVLGGGILLMSLGAGLLLWRAPSSSKTPPAD